MILDCIVCTSNAIGSFPLVNEIHQVGITSNLNQQAISISEIIFTEQLLVFFWSSGCDSSLYLPPSLRTFQQNFFYSGIDKHNNTNRVVTGEVMEYQIPLWAL